jgi:hypothetical protein
LKKKAKHKKPHIAGFHLYKTSRANQKRLVIARTREREMGSHCLKGRRFPFGVMKIFCDFE